MSRWMVVRWRRPPLSFRLDARALPTAAALTMLLFGVLALHIAVGEYPIPVADVVRTLLGGGPEEFDFVVKGLRLPRGLTAMLVGLALGVAGAILQGLTRNALASPDVIGITAGAGVAAAAVIVLAPGVPWAALPPIAFLGGLTAAVLAYLLAWQRGSHPIRLILVGIAIAAVCHALINLIVSSGRVYRVSEAMLWLTGSVYGRTWDHIGALAPWLALFLPLALGLARHLDALGLGDDVARGLGAAVERYRGLLLLTGVALSGAAVATAGTVGFVGLMAPHIARRLVGGTHAALLPVAGLVGGLLVLAADLVGRTLFAPIQIPAGVVTAAVGAPYFLWLLLRSRHG